ncbi:MAG: type II toxin-antitoxin system VapC family toxin [Lachnospiraceae bacterium]|nr:type II toxin-antitoxin system VapC family toxin [Lachnospiraceae bacterium]
MFKNSHMLDANAVLRFLLQDIEEQFQEVKAVIKRERCYVTLEVMAEVCYVLEGLYQVSREDIVDNFRKINFDVINNCRNS